MSSLEFYSMLIRNLFTCVWCYITSLAKGEKIVAFSPPGIAHHRNVNIATSQVLTKNCKKNRAHTFLFMNLCWLLLTQEKPHKRLLTQEKTFFKQFIWSLEKCLLLLRLMYYVFQVNSMHHAWMVKLYTTPPTYSMWYKIPAMGFENGFPQKWIVT